MVGSSIILSAPPVATGPTAEAGRAAGTRSSGAPVVLLHHFICFPPFPHQFVETISSKQTELDTFIAEGYKTALSEERRRYCFLVDRQCAVAKNSSAYHGKVSPPPSPYSCSSCDRPPQSPGTRRLWRRGNSCPAPRPLPASSRRRLI